MTHPHADQPIPRDRPRLIRRAVLHHPSAVRGRADLRHRRDLPAPVTLWSVRAGVGDRLDQIAVPCDHQILRDRRPHRAGRRDVTADRGRQPGHEQLRPPVRDRRRVVRHGHPLTGSTGDRHGRRNKPDLRTRVPHHVPGFGDVLGCVPRVRLPLRSDLASRFPDAAGPRRLHSCRGGNEAGRPHAAGRRHWLYRWCAGASGHDRDATARPPRSASTRP